MYQDVEGEPFCLNCPSGWRQDQDGQPDCLKCLLGRYMSDAKSNNSACTPCNKGTYQDALGQSKCKSCLKGRYNENQLATSSSFCMNCPKGKYSSAMGVTNMTDCNACAAGKKNDNEGSSSSSACIDCLPNTKAETAGLDKCVDCDAGATSELGSSKCQLCEAGKYSDNVGGERECKSCDVGQYRRTSKSEEDATSCVDCLAGFYQSDRGQANCLPCIRESFLLVHELFSFFFHLPSSIFHMLTLFLFNFFNFNFILNFQPACSTISSAKNSVPSARQTHFQTMSIDHFRAAIVHKVAHHPMEVLYAPHAVLANSKKTVAPVLHAQRALRNQNKGKKNVLCVVQQIQNTIQIQVKVVQLTIQEKLIVNCVIWANTALVISATSAVSACITMTKVNLFANLVQSIRIPTKKVKHRQQIVLDVLNLQVLVH